MSDRKVTLDDIAPYPKRMQDVTADGMARHWAAFVQLHYRMSVEHPDRDKAKESIGWVTAYYGVTYLLRELQEHAGVRQANEVARTLWAEWDAGSGLGVDIWNWLVDDYAINPAEINEIAERLIAEDAKADGGES